MQGLWRVPFQARCASSKQKQETCPDGGPARARATWRHGMTRTCICAGRRCKLPVFGCHMCLTVGPRPSQILSSRTSVKCSHTSTYGSVYPLRDSGAEWKHFPEVTSPEIQKYLVLLWQLRSEVHLRVGTRKFIQTASGADECTCYGLNASSGRDPVPWTRYARNNPSKVSRSDLLTLESVVV